MTLEACRWYSVASIIGQCVNNKTLNFICYTYNIQNKYTISESCIPKLKDDEDEGDVRTAEAILDFIELRSQAVEWMMQI